MSLIRPCNLSVNQYKTILSHGKTGPKTDFSKKLWKSQKKNLFDFRADGFLDGSGLHVSRNTSIFFFFSPPDRPDFERLVSYLSARRQSKLLTNQLIKARQHHSRTPVTRAGQTKIFSKNVVDAGLMMEPRLLRNYISNILVNDGVRGKNTKLLDFS